MRENWQKFCKYLYQSKEPNLQLDISRMEFTESYLEAMEPRMQEVVRRIQDLEDGGIVNVDEHQMAGHYWLRAPELAPTPELEQTIRSAQAQVKDFARKVHQGILRGQTGLPYTHVLVIGIGGSHLGPSFISDALWEKDAPCVLHFINNTDPDGLDRTMELLSDKLEATLTVVISKSGATVETRNSLEEVRRYYAGKGLELSRQAICITKPGSKLDQMGRNEGWLDSFPIWDWVGGRTSLFSPVGLLPLALQGIDVQALLDGAARCDALTRHRETRQNPAALMALMWYAQTGGQGGHQMVILPYKDRLELLGKHLQQLIMESLGKEKDLDGKIVHQGLTVFGSKGSTDQHTYVQQLLDGPGNFFVVFIEVLKDRKGPSPIIAEDSSSGDYLQAFLLGTQKAFSQRNRSSLTLTLPEISPANLGALIALFERTVSYYALMVNINAYHQPAVELGKKAANDVIALKNQALSVLRARKEPSCSLEELARAVEASAGPGKDSVERDILFKILQHLAANPYEDEGILLETGGGPLDELRICYRKIEMAERLS